MKPQLLSRADTDTLRRGVCPNCNQTKFLLAKSLWHTIWEDTAAAFRPILCLGCFREFGVAPYNDGTAVILEFVCPNRRLQHAYNIHIGAYSNALPCSQPATPALA